MTFKEVQSELNEILYKCSYPCLTALNLTEQFCNYKKIIKKLKIEIELQNNL